MSGVQCVMIDGTIQMPELPADSWDYPAQVSILENPVKQQQTPWYSKSAALLRDPYSPPPPPPPQISAHHNKVVLKQQSDNCCSKKGMYLSEKPSRNILTTPNSILGGPKFCGRAEPMVKSVFLLFLPLLIKQSYAYGGEGGGGQGSFSSHLSHNTI